MLNIKSSPQYTPLEFVTCYVANPCWFWGFPTTGLTAYLRSIFISILYFSIIKNKSKNVDLVIKSHDVYEIFFRDLPFYNGRGYLMGTKNILLCKNI